MGLYQEFNPNRKLNFMGDYINGLNRDGIWRKWHNNGQIAAVMFYDGTKGALISVASNGLISKECWNERGYKIECK